MISKLLIAKKYSEALFDVALKAKVSDKVIEELERVLQILDAAHQVRYFIMSKVVPMKTKFIFLNTAIEHLKLHKVTVGLLHTLVTNNRMYALPEIKDAYEAQLRQHRNQEAVQVEVAVQLNKKEEKTLTEALTKALNKEIQLKVLVKPELLGGMIVRHGSKMLDNSLSSKLQKIARLVLS